MPTRMHKLGSFLTVCFFAINLQSENCYSDETTRAELIALVDKQTKAVGHAIDDLTFWEILAHQGPISPEDYMITYKHWMQTQTPQFAKADILKVVTEKSKSIWSMNARYRRLTSNSSKTLIDNSIIRWAMNRDSYYLEITKLSLANGRPSDHTISVMNNGIVREYQPQAHRGSIAPAGQISQFIPTESPLANIMLVDGRLPEKMYTYNVVSLLQTNGVYAIGNKFTVNGIECIKLIMADAFEIFLDPSKEFSVVKFAAYTKKPQDSSGMLDFKERWQTYVRTNTDFTDCGDGVWIPKSVHVQFTDKNGQISEAVEVKVEDIDVNHEVPDSVFHVEFPRDTVVTDIIKNSISVVGSGVDKDAIKALGDGVRRERASSKWSIKLVLAANLALAIILGSLFIYNRYRRNASNANRGG